MTRTLFLAVAAAALAATPVFAGPTPKRPTCQIVKAPAREAKRIEPCRRQVIPPVVDPTPMFLIATAAGRVVKSDLS